MFNEWNAYKRAHNKFYNHHDEASHLGTWLRNKKIINEHNKKFQRGEVSYKMAINKFTDMNHEERQMFIGSKVNLAEKYRNIKTLPWNRSTVLGDSMDWREKGAVTPVKDQGPCGSCYSFSSTGALEGQLKQSSGNLVSLSEQQIMDCTGMGCRGGHEMRVFDYLKDAGGIQAEDTYPYTAEDGAACSSDASKVVATLSGYSRVEPNEDALKETVSSQGPVAVGIEVKDSFFSFSTGIYSEADCTAAGINHAVLVVGYGDDYWLVKNSWVSKCDEIHYESTKTSFHREHTGVTKATSR
jgi:C1A family cysteine protease